MKTSFCRLLALMKASSPSRRTVAMQHGFTLVELLMAVALGSVVLASLGGFLLVSELRVSAKIQRNLASKDAATRAIHLMREEALLSSYIRGPVVPASDFCDDAPLAYVQRGDPTGKLTICYKLLDSKNPPSDLPDIYQNAFDGQCVLLRKGPSYKPNGDLDTSSDSVIQVLLVGPAQPCTFTVALTSTITLGASTYSRNADIQLKLDSSKPYSFSARVPSNPAYDGNDFYQYTCSSEESQAGSCSYADLAVLHLKQAKDYVGATSKENIVYFDNPASAYTLLDQRSGSASCTYAQCYVEERRGGLGVQLSFVDALVFTDKEIRPR